MDMKTKSKLNPLNPKLTISSSSAISYPKPQVYIQTSRGHVKRVQFANFPGRKPFSMCLSTFNPAGESTGCSLTGKGISYGIIRTEDMVSM